MNKKEFFNRLGKLIIEFETDNGRPLERVIECEINFISENRNYSWNGEKFIMDKEIILTDDMHEVSVGDVLKSEHGYFVLVCKSSDNNLYGSLLCTVVDSCREIPYSLNNGNGHTFTGLNIGRHLSVEGE